MHTTFKQFLGEMIMVPGKVMCICQGLKISERQIKASEKDPGIVYELKRSRVLVHACPAVNSGTGHLKLPMEEGTWGRVWGTPGHPHTTACVITQAPTCSLGMAPLPPPGRGQAHRALLQRGHFRGGRRCAPFPLLLLTFAKSIYTCT